MPAILLTQSTTFIIGPVAKLLGVIMNGIYVCCDFIGIQNIGLCIILFTIITNLLMLPLTIRQQKFSKMQAVMQPELQKIQKKYEGKKDNESQMKQSEETRALYDKYGVSATGSCLQLLIQMPIMFALYQVIQNVPAYINSIKSLMYVEGDASSLVNLILERTKAVEFMQDAAAQHAVRLTDNAVTANKAVDILYKLSPANWLDLEGVFKSLGELDIVEKVSTISSEIMHMNNFFGINIIMSPWDTGKQALEAGNYLLLIGAAMIPILTGLSQYINTKFMPAAASNDKNKEKSSMENSMGMMNKIFPLMTLAMAINLPSGLAIYWIAGSVVRTIQQIAMNKYFKKIDVDDMVKQNVAKVNKKRAKKGLPPQKVSTVAKVNTRTIKEPQKKEEVSQEKKDQLAKERSDFYNKDAKPGSLASKAAMVQRFNEKNKK